MDSMPAITSALETLAAFRHGIAADLVRVSAAGESRADRSAAKETMQLAWCFVVSDFVVTPVGESLLRAVFPDELFGADPDTKFSELRTTVEDNYAAAWKFSAGDHLCELVRSCVSTGDLVPIDHYRNLALGAAVEVCRLNSPVSARAVLDLAILDSMLRRVRILTEVATDEAAVPSVEQIRDFCAHVPPEHSKSFAFLAMLDGPTATEMLKTFAAQYGWQVTAEVLQQALAEPLPCQTHEFLQDLIDRNLPDGDLPDSDLPDSDLPDSDLPDSDLPDGDLPDEADRTPAAD